MTMLRYVILQHEWPCHAHRPVHWDLMLESRGMLATWALSAPPAPGREIVAERLADHRRDYLDYEGPVSGDRGTVTRWDAGQYQLESQTPSAWVVTVHGHRLVGRLAMEADAEDASRWIVRLASRDNDERQTR